ncbi:hypothetical protein [Vibrio cyclitrophicus]|uniref:hypothetical protein n=1 Tax=Vibrio cyclitrophicus TaxID=47951 RepID=UPI000C866C0A|nr:hypothetical protein [Vibrio cyclitrophicus]PMK96683.1 hypothetical protein BCT87_09315 [Vibrio cyclitrophicus]
MKFSMSEVFFEIHGDSKEADFLREEFRNVKSNAIEESDIVIRFVSKHSAIDDAVIVGSFLIGEKNIRHDMPTFSYQLSSIGKRYELEIKVKTKRRVKKILPEKVLSLLEMSNLKYHELVGKNILYDCLDFVFQHALLKKNKSFIHASSGVIKDKSYAFLAWGGVGKSTSLLKLMHEKGMKYLSDDLGILSSDGTLSYNPKKMQIYAYNLQGQQWLEDKLLSGRDKEDLLAWKLRLKVFGIKRVRRRVSVESIFGENCISSPVLANQIIYLERKNNSRYEYVNSSVDYVSNKAAYVLSEELKPYSLISSAYKSTFPNGNLILSHEELFNMSLKIIKSGLSASSNKITSISIPINATPDEMLNDFELNEII